MKKTMPLIGMLIAVALVPSIIGALLGTEETRGFVIDFLLFGPIIPIVALSIILWLLGKEPQESHYPATGTAPPEPEPEREEAPTSDAPEDEPEEEPSEPEAEENAALEIEEEIEKETSEKIESLCPTCGATCPLEDTYCPHCGAEFEDETDKESPDSRENEIESTEKGKKK